MERRDLALEYPESLEHRDFFYTPHAHPIISAFGFPHGVSPQYWGGIQSLLIPMPPLLSALSNGD